MKKIAAVGILIFSLAFFTPHNATADALPDGYREIQNYAMIENLTSYPGYNFYMVGGDHHSFPDSDQLSSSKVNVYVEGKGELIAVKKSDESKIDHSDNSEGDNWFNLADNKMFIIPSTLSIEFNSMVPDANPVTSTTQVIHIDRLTGSEFSAHIVTANEKGSDVTVVNTADSNTQLVAQPVAVQAAQTAGPQPTSSNPVNNYLVGALAVCVGIIGLLAGKIMWKK